MNCYEGIMAREQLFEEDSIEVRGKVPKFISANIDALAPFSGSSKATMMRQIGAARLDRLRNGFHRHHHRRRHYVCEHEEDRYEGKIGSGVGADQLAPKPYQ